ncbi:MAG: hypothetical protein ACFB9M_14440 [Myxococcota bacterium]
MRAWSVLFALSAVTCGGPREDGAPAPSADVSGGVDFGVVPVGLRVEEPLGLSGSGRLTSVSPGEGFQGAEYAFSVLSGLPLDLEAGSDLRFAFEAEGEVAGAVATARLEFEDGTREEILLFARTGLALDVRPVTLDFGEVRVGRGAERTIRIRNRLERDIPVFAQVQNGFPTVTPLAGTARFEIAAATEERVLAAANPLAPDDSFEITVRYTAGPTERDEAEWILGPCPRLGLCGTAIRLLGQPSASPLRCEGAALRDGRVDAGILNPPERFSMELTCTALESSTVRAVVKPEPGRGFELNTDLSFPAVLQPSDSFSVEVGFDPSELEAGAGAVTSFAIVVEDPSSPTEPLRLRFDLAGAHGYPVLRTEVESLDFQSVQIGTVRPDRLRVFNDGPVPFVGHVRFSGGAESPFSGPLDQVAIPPRGFATIDLAFGPRSLGENSGLLRLVSASPRTPDAGLEVALRGTARDLGPCRLEVTSSSLHLGRGVTDLSLSGFVSLHSLGPGACIINGIGLGQGGDERFSIRQPSPLTSFETILDESESLLLEVGFRARAPSDDLAEGSVQFYASSDSGWSTVSITATPSADPVLAAPGVVDLRGRSAGCPEDAMSVSILNASSEPRRISDVRLEGSEAFEIDAPAVPTRLEPFNRIAVKVRFFPDRWDGSSVALGALKVLIDNSDGPLVIPLLGRAQDGIPFREAFVQGAPEASVLVLPPFQPDRAGTDAPTVQAAFASMFDPFIEPFLRAGGLPIDYRIGFITGDRSGCIDAYTGQPFPSDLRHEGSCGLVAVGAQDRFRSPEWKTISRGEEPSPSEVFSIQFRRGAADGLKTPLRNIVAATLPISRDWNREIFAERRYVHVLVVDNQDAEPDADLPEFAADYLRAFRGYDARFRVGASLVTAPGETACTFGDSTALPTPQYRRFWARLGGGGAPSLCAEDLAALVTALGEDASGLRRHVRLTRSTTPSSLTVRTDGNVLPEREGEESNWSLGPPSDEGVQVLTLSSPRALRPGTSVELSYAPNCSSNVRGPFN